MNNYTTKEKKKLLATMFELKILLGEDIIQWVGLPLTYFDFDAVSEVVKEKQKRYDLINKSY